VNGRILRNRTGTKGAQFRCNTRHEGVLQFRVCNSVYVFVKDVIEHNSMKKLLQDVFQHADKRQDIQCHAQSETIAKVLTAYSDVMPSKEVHAKHSINRRKVHRKHSMLCSSTAPSLMNPSM
jgi:hypothetical protein